MAGYDIYTFELPANLRPHMVTYVKGTVDDAVTKQPLEAAVEIIDLEKTSRFTRITARPNMAIFWPH